MKNFQTNLSKWPFFLILIVILSKSAIVTAAPFKCSYPDCQIDSAGNAVAVWRAIDHSTGYGIIQASTMNAAGSWTPPVTISTSISTNITNDIPVLYSNTNGDVVAIWSYFNYTDNNGYVAASMLPHLTTSWNTATVSTANEFAYLNDQTLSLNSAGQIVATWSSINPSQQTERIRSSIATMGAFTTWTPPVTVSQ